MWSLCLLINKLLNLEEGEEHGFNEKDFSLIGSCLLKLSSTDGLNNDVVLPDCHIIAVRQSSFHWPFHPNCFLWLLNLQAFLSFCFDAYLNFNQHSV
ncbi:hypothetical protein Dimus_012785 [Dionaea muscipula]